MAELEGRIKDVEEFAEILKGIKGTGREYKDFVAGAIAGVRMAWVWIKKRKRGSKMKKKMKEIQENNPKLFSWIIGGIAGWTVTAISAIIYFLVN